MELPEKLLDRSFCLIHLTTSYGTKGFTPTAAMQFRPHSLKASLSQLQTTAVISDSFLFHPRTHLSTWFRATFFLLDIYFTSESWSAKTTASNIVSKSHPLSTNAMRPKRVEVKTQEGSGDSNVAIKTSILGAADIQWASLLRGPLRTPALGHNRICGHSGKCSLLDHMQPQSALNGHDFNSNTHQRSETWWYRFWIQ